MTYDLTVWPVDRALTFEEAATELGRLGGMLSFLRGPDERLEPFIAAMEERYPGLRSRGAVPPPFEFDIHPRHAFLGIPWSMAEAVVGDVAEAAYRCGLAVYDPQRKAVGLPAPFTDAPMTVDGVEAHVQKADAALAAIQQGAAMANSGESPSRVRRATSRKLPAAGYHEMSALGFEVTPEVEEEYFADPLRMPSSLQTRDRKAQLIADMGSSSPRARHAALGQLAGWDPDPDVASALRPVLNSEDVFEAGQAAGGLARQGDITDLPAVLDLVHRMSPADGGSAEAMLLPLRAALALATPAGPMVVSGVKARARMWRGAPPVRRQAWEREFDRELEELLGDA